MRYELSDCEWSVIKPMLPNKPRGIPRVDDRRVLNGIFWVLRLGALWRDLPEIYGRWGGRAFVIKAGRFVDHRLGAGSNAAKGGGPLIASKSGNALSGHRFILSIV